MFLPCNDPVSRRSQTSTSYQFEQPRLPRAVVPKYRYVLKQHVTVCHSHEVDILDEWASLAKGEVKRGRQAGQKGKQETKREAERNFRLAQRLTSITKNQLSLVSSLLDDNILDAVAIASKLPHTNQGRQRQEKLVGKLLATHYDNDQTPEIVDAVDQATGASVGGGGNPADELALGWRRAVLEGDQETLDEIISYAVAAGEDVADLNRHVRRARQEAQATEASPQPIGESDGEQGTSDNSAAVDGEGALEKSASFLGDIGVQRRTASIGQRRSMQKGASRERKALLKRLRRIAEQALATSAQ